MPRSAASRASPPAPAATVTIREVAARAGVSLMTVSRAVKQPDRVAAETLARVREAMAELHYVPNLAAAGLRMAQSRFVAAIVPTFATHMFDRMLAALNDRLSAGGYQVWIGQSQYRLDQEDDLIRSVLGRRPDGMLITGSVQTKTGRALLTRAAIPVVEAGDLVRTRIDMNVGFSQEALGVAACRYLAGRGHRRLASLSGDDARAQRRATAFEREAARLGLPAVRVLYTPAPTGYAAGRRLLGELMGAKPKVDAVLCGSDLLASGVLTECRTRGIAVPRQLAVLGTGDAEFAEALDPPLSSIRVDGGRIGEVAAALFLDRFAGRPIAARSTDVGFEIVERTST